MRPLDDPRLKLTRAREHLEALKEARHRFLRDDPYDVVIEGDEKKLLKLTVLKEPPNEMAVIAGDALHNIRSALDHLVWQLALLHTEAPSQSTEFPIFMEKGRFESRKPGGGLYKIRALGSDEQAVVEGLQPYRASDPPRSILWALHELSRIDKHRFLHLGVLGLDATRVSFTNRDGARVEQLGVWGGNPIDQAVVAELPDVAPDSQMDVQVEIVLDVSLDERSAREDGTSASMLNTIWHAHGYVEQVVVPAFERFFD